MIRMLMSDDVEDEIIELESEIAVILDAQEDRGDMSPAEVNALVAIAGLREPYDRWRELVAFRDEVNHPEWNYGVILILEADFTKYVKEYIADIGALPRDLPDWVVIDWDATAENIRGDFMSVDFEGQTYLYRAA